MSEISRSDFLKKITVGGIGARMLIAHPSTNTQAATTGWENHHFRIRGFHVDLRVEIMTIEALKNLASTLALMGINTLILEYTASYPYEKHAVISGPYAYRRDEIEALVSYCKGLGIQVIPLLENLGHVQYILRHEQYANLRIKHSILSQIDPLNKQAIPLFSDLIADLISLHPAKYIHLGGDEARHLHNKKFTEYIHKHGVSKLYTQYIKQICQVAIKKGKTPLLWADMILKYPQAVEDLPVDRIIFIDWNYGWNVNRFGSIKALQDKGCNFWGAPALRSSPDNYFITRWKKHFNNLKNFIPYARKADYSGIIMTSWSTSGVFDYQWQGTSGTLLEMFPQRNVYSLTAFRILIVAYAQALKMKKPFDPEQFVIHYGKQRFGLSKVEGKVLWNYLSHRQVVIGGGDAFIKKDIKKIQRTFQRVTAPLYRLEPNRHKQEFAQFILMADIRTFYLSVRQIESIIESSEFNRSKIGIVKQQLAKLINNSEELDHRFTVLHEGYLHEGELQRLNQLRNKRLNRLWDIYGS